MDLIGLNNGTLISGTTFAAGKVAQAFNLDGVDDRVQVADSDSLKLTGSMTIEAWVLVRSFPAGSPADHGEIFFRGDDRGGLDPYSVAVEPDGTLRFQIQNSQPTGITVDSTTAQHIWIVARPSASSPRIGSQPVMLWATSCGSPGTNRAYFKTG